MDGGQAAGGPRREAKAGGRRSGLIRGERPPAALHGSGAAGRRVQGRAAPTHAPGPPAPVCPRRFMYFRLLSMRILIDFENVVRRDV
jgi:hypothetical protein